MIVEELRKKMAKEVMKSRQLMQNDGIEGEDTSWRRRQREDEETDKRRRERKEGEEVSRGETNIEEDR